MKSRNILLKNWKDIPPNAYNSCVLFTFISICYNNTYHLLKKHSIF